MLDREQKSATEPEVGRGPRWPRSPASQQGRARSVKPRRRIHHHDRLGVSSVFGADWCDQHPRRNWFSYWPPKALQTPPHFSARISSVTLARVRPSATPPRDPVTDGASSAPWDSGDRSRPASSSPSTTFSAATLRRGLRVHLAAAGAAFLGGACPQSGPVTRIYPLSSGQYRHVARDPQG